MRCDYQWKTVKTCQGGLQCTGIQKRQGKIGFKKHVSIENTQHKHELEGRAAAVHPLEWPKHSQPDDYHNNEERMYELVFSNQQPKAKDCRKHCCHVLFPYVRQQLTNKIQEEHQQAITGHDNQIQALEFRNEEYKKKILSLNKEIDDLIANMHVACHGCFDNVLRFIKKNSEEVHPFHVIRCQYKQLEKHKRWLKLRYKNMEVADKCDDPNAIDRWNRFKREVIKKPNYYKNHFSLMEEKRELLETALDVTI